MLKILRQEMIVDDIHQYPAVFVELFAETVFTRAVHRMGVGKGIDLAVQHNSPHNARRQAAEVIAMHGIGNEIPDNEFVVAER